MYSAHGRFVWHDLITSDPAAARRFYPSVLPWTAQPWEVGAGDYTLWMNGDAPIGGVGPASARGDGDQHAGWRSYVCVYDVDACLRQAQTLGAVVTTPTREVKDVGCWAVLRDPQGAPFGIFEPDTAPPGGDAPPGVGEFSWHELATGDQQASFEFYHALFAWEKTGEHDMGAHGTYVVFGRRGRPCGGMFAVPAAAPAEASAGGPGAPPRGWLCYVRVDDIAAGARAVTAAGGRVLRGPHEVPGGDQIVQCADPQGATFALHTVKAT